MQILAATPGAGFLDRLVVHGRVDIADQKLTSKTEEQKLSAFSQRARVRRTPGAPMRRPRTVSMCSPRWPGR